jgi:ribosomal peptide maturation radical SAM protein 1
MRSVVSQVALVYMPFGLCTGPALGLSLLKGALCQQGHLCDIHYFNLALAGEIGFDNYSIVALGMPQEILLGEWLCAPALWGEDPESDQQYVYGVLWEYLKDELSPWGILSMLRLRERMTRFVRECFESVDWSRYRLVGLSVLSSQVCASLALARLIKAQCPDLPIILGGPACTGEMGAGILRLFPFIDFVCTGEGEAALPVLVEALLNGRATAPIPGILSRLDLAADVLGSSYPVDDMDSLPWPDFSDYLAQLHEIPVPPGFEPVFPLEAARGCWWGQEHHCTFCGLNGATLTFRSKSSSRVMDEIQRIKQDGGRAIRFVDNMLDYRYFRTLLPELAERPLGVEHFFEVRADLRREQLALLARAGTRFIQPGIESLSDSILRLMNKGTRCHQNIQVLKWCRQYGMEPVWNILYGFPGEDSAEYVAMKRLIPLLVHLEPPRRCIHVAFHRFSPYVTDPAAFGITRLTPAPAYGCIHRSLSADDLAQIASTFVAEYPDDSATYAQSLLQAVQEWRARTDAALDAFPSPDSIRIVDTRRRGERKEYRLDGLAARLYLRCDAAQSIRSLMDAPSIRERASEAEVVALLDQFVGKGLMICDGQQYLGLAVVRDDSAAKATART